MTGPGRLVADRYRLDALVGSGAMGVVYRAEDERLRRIVALKQVTISATAGDEARDVAHRRVIREGRMIARLQHPNAISVFDVVDHDDEPWLVMEYLPSRSLAEVLAQDGPLAPARVADLGRQIAAGLAAAHEAGIVHRDVKPGNVLLAEGGLAKVTDFGIARAVDDVTLTSSGMVAGTPAYLAPEVARGGSPDFRSDVGSLGSTLYAAVEGGPPYGSAENALAQLHRVASGDADPPQRAGSLTPLLLRLLDGDPDHRPAMPRVRDELVRLAEAEADTGAGPITPMLPLPGSLPSSSPPSSPTAPAAPPAPGPSSPPSPGSTSSSPGPNLSSPPGPGPTSSPPGPSPTSSSPGPSPSSSPGPNPSSSPGPGRTSPPPPPVRTPSAPRAGGPRTPPAPVPAPTVPAATTPVAEPRPPRRRRRLVLLGGIGAVVVAAAVVAAILLGTGTVPSPISRVPDPPDVTAAPGSSSGSGDGSASTSGTDTQRAQQQAVIDYYALLPGRLDEGWARLTPHYQQTTADGFGGYSGFWSAIGRVTVRGVSPSSPGDGVDATVTYTYRDGRVVTERTIFTMAQVDGSWKIDGSTVVSSR